LAVQWPYIFRRNRIVAGTARTRDKRLEVRTTADERALIDRAAAAVGTDVTTFVVAHVTEAAQRVLADRDRFELSASAAAEWDKINDQPARDLPGLRRLFERPSPFDS
jgi:uncharacterized protein (DUF1778 family)